MVAQMMGLGDELRAVDIENNTSVENNTTVYESNYFSTTYVFDSHAPSEWWGTYWHHRYDVDCDELTYDGRPQKWRREAADKDGWIAANGYVFATVDLPAAATMRLDAQGESLVYVNGVPRAGDVYETGYVHLPVRLRAGRNTLLFYAGGWLQVTGAAASILFFLCDRDEIGVLSVLSLCSESATRT